VTGGPIDVGFRPYRAGAWHYAEYRFKVLDGLIDVLADRLGWNGGTRVLDLCCGPAHLSIPVAGRVGQVVGIDIEPETLEEGRRRLATAQVENVVLLEGPAEAADELTEGLFDAVTVGWGFHWLADPDGVLARLAGTTVPGAAVVVIGDPSEPAGSPEPPPSWHREVDAILDRYLEGTPGPPRQGPHRPYQDILSASPFCHLDELTVEAEVEFTDSLESRIGFLYSLAGTLDRLAGRRAEFEAEVRGSLSELAPVAKRLRRTDRALIGRRGGG